MGFPQREGTWPARPSSTGFSLCGLICGASTVHRLKSVLLKTQIPLPCGGISEKSHCAPTTKFWLVLGGERQQHISGHAAIAGISGIDEDHAADDDRAGSVERAALGLDSIYGRVFLRGIKIPEDFAVFRRERAHMAVERAGEDDAGDQRERSGLARAAPRTRRIAWIARREPGLPT